MAPSPGYQILLHFVPGGREHVQVHVQQRMNRLGHVNWISVSRGPTDLEILEANENKTHPQTQIVCPIESLPLRCKHGKYATMTRSSWTLLLSFYFHF